MAVVGWDGWAGGRGGPVGGVGWGCDWAVGKYEWQETEGFEFSSDVLQD